MLLQQKWYTLAISSYWIEWDIWSKSIFSFIANKKDLNACIYIFPNGQTKTLTLHISLNIESCGKHQGKFSLQGIRLDKVVCYKEHSFNLPDINMMSFASNLTCYLELAWPGSKLNVAVIWLKDLWCNSTGCRIVVLFIPIFR